jgi:hypothetical protein
MLRSLLERLRSWWAVDDPDERIDGEGDVYLDPAYNGRYTAERKLKEYAELEEEADEQPPDRP